MRHTVYFLAFSALLLAPQAFGQFGMAGPTITQEAFVHSDVAPAGGAVQVSFRFEMDPSWHVNSNKPLESFLIPTELSFADSETYTVQEVIYPEAKELTLEFSPDQPLAVYETGFVVTATLDIAESAPEGEQAITATLRYQACNDKQCAPPKSMDFTFPLQIAPAGTEATPRTVQWGAGTADAADTEEDAGSATPAESARSAWQTLADDFEITSTLGGFEDTQGFLQFIDVAEGLAEAEEGFEEKGWLTILGLVLVGGFLLNLTPCVLPLIPINIAIIGAGARAGSRARGFALGGAYGLGIAAVYGALGLVVVLGVSTAFGQLNANLWFNLGIGVFFVVMALAMFDIIAVDFSKFQSSIGIRKNDNGSYFIALAMGAISALLAGACVAPVVISTLVYAQDQYARGVTLALALPFLLGVGMALPWPFAGAGLSFLPKPGVWMTRVKYAFGVFMIGMGAYYAFVAYEIWDSTRVNPEEVLASVEAADESGWLHSLEEGLALAQAENKPVLLDFWATWCKNCLVMNNTVLKDAEVLRRLEGYVKVKYQAEDPSAPATAEVLERFGVLGLPTYIILEPR